MEFPHDDQFWVETLNFVDSNIGHSQRILAPAEFEQVFPGRVVAYEQVNEDRNLNIQCAILHKGRLARLTRAVLTNVHRGMRPVFANEVFVVFANLGELPSVSSSSPHLVSYWNEFAKSHPGAVVRFKTRAWLWLREKSIALAREVMQDLQPQIILALREQALSMAGNARSMVYLGDNRALTRTVFGHKMIVDTRDISLAYHLLLDGYWESWITNVFNEKLREGMTVVEVGANVGYYSLLAAAKIGPRGKLYCFEANPDITEILSTNVEINGFSDRAQIINMAVYSHSGELRFYVLPKHMGGSRLFRPDGENKPIAVKAISLDEFFPAGTRVDFLKVDAEGAEAFILQGSQRLLRENPQISIVMEFIPNNLKAADSSPEKFLQDLSALGFKLSRIDEDGTVKPTTIEQLLLSPGHSELYLVRE
jgi:FkbM family methyltransferase